MWPHSPRQILSARIQGHLYDLTEFPALVLPGDDWIVGECWCFAASEMPPTLKVLDEIEEHAGRPDDLYSRVIVTCESTTGDQVMAYTYIYCRPHELAAQWRLAPGSDGTVSWTPR